ncbi:MAG: hypothetical protein KUG81_09990 [Gammaproteobacteria bacterium]|nr:hypothetical protein [Gammaproteobacteria bacterium]
MKILINVRVEGIAGNFVAGVDVQDVFRVCFKPLRSGDVPLISAFDGEVSSSEAARQMELRKDAAKIIADDLAGLIVSAMRSKDTHNGYKIER